MNDNFTIKKIIIRGLLSGLLFTVLWSTWAYFANLSHGEEAASRAAYTQGSFTIINAFFYTMFMEYMFALGKTPAKRFMLAFVVPNLLVTTILSGLHYVRGTPNLLTTVGLLLVFIYTLSLVYVLVIGPRKLKSVEEFQEHQVI